MAREGFNATERAKEREGAPIVFGETQYHPRRLTNKRFNEVQRMSQVAQRETDELNRETEEYKAAFAEAMKSSDDKEAADAAGMLAGSASEVVVEQSANALAQQLQQLLVDDNMQVPTTEALRHHIDEDLDTRDVGPLLTYLLGADPTPAAS